ncbi:MAG: VCBS repeat-containing protein, partial [Flavobacteriales bacterium]
MISTAVEYAIFVNTADLDGDGDNDVLSASVTDNKVAWYENRGDGNFYEQQVISTAAYWALSIVTGDVDGDGDLDVFSNSQGDDKIAWYENQGNLGFGPQQVLTVSARIPIITRTADLDGDGDPDVLVGMTSHSRIAWYENLGGGLTGPQQEITSQVADLRDLRTADLDGDGDLDLLSASFEDHKFAWYANDGSGGFGPQQLIGTVMGGPVSICPADLDGDGDQDVLGGHSELERYMNDGLGNFTPLPPVAGFHGVLSSVDIDGDGDLDCLANGMLGMLGAIVWARNDGLGGFGTDRFISFAWGRSLTAADMDGDGDPDVITSSFESDTLVWYPNNGLGVFGPPQVISSLVTNVFQVLAADMDADGDQDVLSASYDDDEFAWYQNDGSGVFGPQLIIDATVDGANCIATTDMDGDGDLDLVGAGYNDIDVVWYENHVGSLYRIDGTVFMDADQNGSFDGADVPFPYAPVSITPMLSTVMSGAAGTYTAFVDTGTFALESVLSAPLWTLTTSPAVRSVQITTLEPQVAGVDFGWAPAIDTSIVLPGFTLGTGPCGSTVHSWLSYRNLGTRIEQGTITLELDPVFSFVSSIPPPSTIVGNTLTWEFDSLNWFAIGQIPMEIQLPPSATDWTSTTTVATVDSLGASTGVFTLPQSGFIGCAYDPNDKQVEPQGYGIHGAVAIDTEWLTYTIRFQNTGTGTAYNVSIIDQLDGDLDRSSLEILGTSHPITSMQIDAAGKAIFRFNNIMLPDSNVSRSASQGYLRYRIRPAEGAADGTQITNAASILFDLNPAIVTNTVTNTLVDCSLFSAEIGWGDVDSLVATAGDHYQWYHNDDSIAGAEGQGLIVTEPGS